MLPSINCNFFKLAVISGMELIERASGRLFFIHSIVILLQVAFNTHFFTKLLPATIVTHISSIHFERMSCDERLIIYLDVI